MEKPASQNVGTTRNQEKVGIIKYWQVPTYCIKFDYFNYIIFNVLYCFCIQQSKIRPYNNYNTS